MRVYRFTLCLYLAACLFLATSAPAFAWRAEQAEAAYIGAKGCQSCHEEQFDGFMKNSSKADSWKSVTKMLPKLTEKEKAECYMCHTTGYGAKGGFESIEKTPDLANLSCETCHGPGSLHAETGDTESITRKPDVESCVTCHNAERIQNFNFKPMLYHGGH